MNRRTSVRLVSICGIRAAAVALGLLSRGRRAQGGPGNTPRRRSRRPARAPTGAPAGAPAQAGPMFDGGTASTRRSATSRAGSSRSRTSGLFAALNVKIGSRAATRAACACGSRSRRVPPGLQMAGGVGESSGRPGWGSTRTGA